MKYHYFILIIGMMCLIAGCQDPILSPLQSVKKTSRTAGTNGGFEITKSGYPANWNVYYQPIKNGDVDIAFDTEDFVEGKQSFKLIVYNTDLAGGIKTAGLYQLFDAQEKRRCKVSFWMKNQGCRVRVFIGSEKCETGILAHPIEELLGSVETDTDIWRKYEYTYTIPEKCNNVRFEINVLLPGLLWIDDMRIEEFQTEGS